MQPDETAFPETQETLGLLASAALPADARARHLHAIRMRAAELGPAPAPATAGKRPPLTEGLSGVRWRGRRAAAIAGVWMGSLSLGTGVAAAAAMDDLPGQPLYGLKRAVENVQLHLPGDAADDVRRRLDLAARRLAEAEALYARGADATLLASTLGDAQTLIDEAGELAQDDADLSSAVAGSASQARVRLAELLSGGLPEQAADRAREAIEAATERAEQRAQEREDAEGNRGRGRGGDDEAGSPATLAPGERDDDGGQGRGRGRGGDDADTGDADEADQSDSGARDRGGAPPSESGDDEDASPSGRGRSSDDDEPDTPEAEDDEDEDGPGVSQGSARGQANAGQGTSASQGGGSQGNVGQGGGSAHSGQGNARRDED